MSLLSDLRAALGALDSLECGGASCLTCDNYDQCVADDTTRALLDVAEAVGTACEGCLDMRHPDYIDPTVQGFCRDACGCRFADAREKLAPLVKEATDE